MKTKKFTFKPTLTILFCILLFAGSVEAQELTAGSKDRATAAATTSSTFEDLESITLGNLTGAKAVMVISNIEMQTGLDATKNVTGYFELKEGSTSSPEITRYVVGKAYSDYGLAAVCNIFEYGTAFTGSKTFALRHRRLVNGASKYLASKANMVAIVIDDANVTLPYSVETSTNADETTSSSTYAQISGVVTSAYTLSVGDAVYLSTAFSTKDGGEAGYAIRVSSDAGGSWTTLSEIARTNTDELGAATITYLFVATSAENYLFEVAHKASSGTLTTSNITFIAVGLKDDNGNVYPHFKSTALSGGPITTTTPTEIAGGPTPTSQNASNSIFAHTTFNLSNGSGTDLNTAGIKLGFTNSTFTPITFNRYIEASATGSGGLVGLASEIKYNAVPQISLYHNSDGTQSLTTDNVNIVGFQLKSTPKICALGGDLMTAGSWDPSGVPDAKDNLVIIGVSTNNTGALVCYDLCIAPTGSLNLSGGTLTPGGIFSIESDATNSGSFINTTAVATNITYNRYMTGGDKWHLISSPVVGQDIGDLLTNTNNGIAYSIPNSNYAMADYDEASGHFNAFFESTVAGDFIEAKGYEVLRSSSGEVSFTGTINTADETIAITRGGNGWNLIGNPYPSAICVNTDADGTNNLITVNTAQLDEIFTIYFWDAASSAYVAVSNASAADYVPPGQGFFVKSKIGGGIISITEAMQSHQPSADFKSTNSVWPRINLLVETSETKRSTQIAFNSEMTNGLDVGYDAGIFKSGSLSLYSRLLEDNGVDFAIQCLPEEYDELVIPIGLDALAGTNLVFSAEINNIPENFTFLLEDTQTGIITELGQNSYTIELDAASNGIGRFYLHANRNNVGIDNLYLHPEETFKIISNSQSGNIQVLGTINQATKAIIYDMRGRLITSVQLSRNNENIIPFNNAQNGIYIIRFQSNDRVVSKKFNW